MTGQVPSRARHADKNLNHKLRFDRKSKVKSVADLHYVIIGSGRLANHLKNWLSLVFPEKTNSKKSQIFSQWDRSQNPNLLKKMIRPTSIVLLAISDQAIEPFYKKNLKKLTSHAVVHFAGSLYIPGLVTAHPLMTFGKTPYSLSDYNKIHWTLTGANNIKKIFPFSKNKFTVLPPSSRALYHALCVMTGNFPQILWIGLESSWINLGISRQDLSFYLNTVVSNYQKSGAMALTGPFIRNDIITVTNNINALQNSHLKKLYESFWQFFEINKSLFYATQLKTKKKKTRK